MNIFPPSVGFLIILIAFLTIDLTNLSYALYFKNSLGLKEDKSKIGMNLYWIWLLSFVEIVLFGLLMNIPLADYKKQASQVILLAGLFFLFNEIWLLYLAASKSKVSDIHEKNEKKLRQAYYGEIINCISHFIVLFLVSIKFPFPHNIISLGFLGLIFALVVYYGVNKLRKI